MRSLSLCLLIVLMFFMAGTAMATSSIEPPNNNASKALAVRAECSEGGMVFNECVHRN